jgi:ribose/xylose/arabinose/galactoside ABC-type transport system permease subunit
MILMNVSEYYQMVTRGAVLLAAVVFDNLSKSQQE